MTTKWVVEQLRKAILREIQILEAGKETEVFDHMSKLVITRLSTSSLLTNASQINKRNFQKHQAKT